MITTANEPGALHRVLERLTRPISTLIGLESRPIPGHDFEFMFYFDLDCPWQQGLDDLPDSSTTFSPTLAAIFRRNLRACWAAVACTPTIYKELAGPE